MEKMKKEKKNKSLYIILGLLLAALGLMSVVGVYYDRQADSLRRELHNTYMRAFHDASDYLYDVDVSLKKAVLAKDAGQMADISSRLYMQAEGAKACVAGLPTENDTFLNTSEFLSKVGDYCSFLARKTIRGESVTEEEYQNLRALSEHAESISRAFSDMETEMYQGNLQIESLSAKSPFVVHAQSGFQDSLAQVDAIPQDYPSLIYDGPFSDHLEQETPAYLAGKQKISRFAAESTLTQFLGEERAKTLSYESDGSGTIETYLFRGGENGREISAEVTKHGGCLLWMLDTRAVTESRLSTEQAIAAGELYLSQRGFPAVKSSYYEVADHVLTVNFAPFDRDTETVFYPDLIKVKIALDNGEVVGLEAKGYLMCHKERQLPETVVTEEEAIQAAGTHLYTEKVSMAMIPTDGGKEVFCYELSGNLGKNRFLVYVNALTGAEEKILLILETENGVLTI